METDTFNSPLSFYSVEADYGYDALSLQPEERNTDSSHAHAPSPLPYFDDVSAGLPEVHHDLGYMF